MEFFREQLVGTANFLRNWFGHFTPKTRVGATANAGCLILFPIFTLVMWSFQLMIMITLALPAIVWLAFCFVVLSIYRLTHRSTANG